MLLDLKSYPTSPKGDFCIFLIHLNHNLDNKREKSLLYIIIYL